MYHVMKMEENRQRSGLATTEKKRKRGKEEDGGAERKEKAYSCEEVVKRKNKGGKKVERREAKKAEKKKEGIEGGRGNDNTGDESIEWANKGREMEDETEGAKEVTGGAG